MKKNQFLVFALFVIKLSVFTSCEKDDNEAKKKYLVYDNHIELDGEDNFRDLGGIKAVDGRRILYRKLFRSGELSSLSSEDSAKVVELAIEQMFDLRTPDEVASEPDIVGSHTDVHFFSLLGDLELSSSDIMSGKISTDEYMYNIYTVDATKTALWTQIFDLLETGKVSHWHCTSGKDRAGMTTVLLLHALGSDKETAVANFMESNDYLAESAEEFVESIATMLEGYGYDSATAMAVAQMLQPLALVELDWIEHFYTSIEDKYGDIDSYLDVLGVDRDALREAYVEK